MGSRAFSVRSSHMDTAKSRMGIAHHMTQGQGIGQVLLKGHRSVPRKHGEAVIKVVQGFLIGQDEGRKLNKYRIQRISVNRT